MNIEKFLNISEASEFLRVKKSTLYGWVHERRIPFRKHGKLLIFSASDLVAWSSRQTNCGIEATAQTGPGSLKTERNRN